ncbi:MAG: ABC transporter substrate-binding protein [Armatimonadetes bacterium]|nr:ABC transporter substrate-binding protein [Armatimonadota bacterium]
MIRSRPKQLAVLLVVVLAVAFAVVACGDKATETSASVQETVTTATTGETTATTEATTETTAEETSGVVVDEWTIPVCLGLTGMFAGQAASAQWVVEQAAAAINEAGGIAGKPVALDFYDSAFDSAKAAAAMAQVIDSGALVTIGPWFEPEAAGAMPLAQRAGILEIAQGGEDTAMQYVPWNIWLNFQREDLSHVMDMWHEAVPDMQSCCAIGIGSMASCVSMMEIMLDELATKGVTKQELVDVPMDTVDFATPVAKAMSTGADSFIVMFLSDGGAKIITELVKRGVDPEKIFVTDGMVDSAFLELSTGYNEGCYSNESLTYPYTDTWAQLNADYSASHEGNLINVRWYEFYDALYLIKAAIEDLGLTGDPAKLDEERAAMKDYCGNVDEIVGAKHTYSIVDCFARVPMYLFQIHDNEFTYVDKWEPTE